MPPGTHGTPPNTHSTPTSNLGILFRDNGNQPETHGTQLMEPCDPTWNLLYLTYDQIGPFERFSGMLTTYGGHPKKTQGKVQGNKSTSGR